NGWRERLAARLGDGRMRLVLGFSVEYSSTCPCSAALSRQSNAARLRDDFGDVEALTVDEVAGWLASERGMAATPHAQRSEARVQVELRPELEELPLVALVDALEASLGTPVQTA